MGIDVVSDAYRHTNNSMTQIYLDSIGSEETDKANDLKIL
jgi:hypothetical protein